MHTYQHVISTHTDKHVIHIGQTTHTHTHTQADTQTDFVSVYMHVISVCAQELNHEGQEIVEPEICHEMQIQHA